MIQGTELAEREGDAPNVDPAQAQVALEPAAPVQLRLAPGACLPMEEILELVPGVMPPSGEIDAALRSTRDVLIWLKQFPGDNWQERCEAAGVNSGMAWAQEFAEAHPARTSYAREKAAAGVRNLLLCKVIHPSYELLNVFGANVLYERAREQRSPEVFARFAQAADRAGMAEKHKISGLRVAARLILRTGKDASELTATDVQEYDEWFWARTSRRDPGVRAAWDMMRGIGLIEDVELKSVRRLGQMTTEQLVDQYKVKNVKVRAALVRYLNERRPALDYPSLRTLASQVANLFWADIERHHPEQDTFRLSHEVAAAWRERVAFTQEKPGRPRRVRNDVFAVLQAIRGFFLDIQEWALEDPFWAQWAAPSPVRQQDTAGYRDRKRAVMAQMHQRVRDRLPHLSVLAEGADRHRSEQASLLAAAESVDVGQTFVFDEVSYRRVLPKSAAKDPKAVVTTTRLLIENQASGERTEVRQTEDEAFWSWAIVETLQHTGTRVEELSEITQLALVSYRVPKSAEIVPMLQIVPSKTNEERLLLVSPELANVLATIITRLRKQNGGIIPLTARYDPHERVTGPPLPHLFQRRWGWTNQCISHQHIAKLLRVAAARAGVVDAAGQPLDFTPHDFRRMFATDLVANGLPVHIAAKILGHDNLATTQHYLAVFPEEIVTRYRQFLAGRRNTRPEAEYREPTSEEWQEFHHHFELRKVALGICGRAFGTACPHEHACIRCPMLQVDPREVGRLAGLVKNLKDRLAEAEMYGWGGEVVGIKASLEAGLEKLAKAHATESRRHTNLTDLGIPVFRDGRRP